MIQRSPELDKWGWEFTSLGTPWVAQRVCPIPMVPLVEISFYDFSSRSETFPLVFETFKSVPS